MNRLQFLKYSLLAYPAISAFTSRTSLPDEAPEDAVIDEAYWKLVRSQFPLTDEMTFLNNGTIGVSPHQVIDAMYQKTLAVNTRAIYGGGDHEAIAALARFVGADPEEICFTHNVTE